MSETTGNASQGEAPLSPASGSDAESDARVSGWQSHLLPFMAAVLVCLTVFSCVVNVVETYLVLHHIETNHEIDIKPALAMLDTNVSGLSASDRFAYARWKTLSTLEVNTIESRYHQASIAVMTRVYIVFLSFATGMVLALVGATFILGKLREAPSTVGGGGGFGSFSISSASPGLILAFFGTVLMLFTISSRADISVRDQSLYVPEPMMVYNPNSSVSGQQNAAPVPEAPAESKLDATQRKILEDAKKKMSLPAKP